MKPEPGTRSTGEQIASWLLLLAALSLAVVLARRHPSRPTPVMTAVDPARLIPPGPRLLLTADVAAIAIAAGPALLQAGAAQLLGLRELCGFEPLLGVERIAFAMPTGLPEDKGSDFALIASTSLELEAGLRCAERVIQKRGGTSARTQLGAFTAVRDQKRPLGEVAQRQDGTLVLSGGSYFRDVMDAAQGSYRADEAAKLRDQLHRRLRAQLGPGQLSLTLLPGALVTLGAGVEALGVSLSVGRELTLRGFVGCRSVEACGQARSLIDATKAEALGDPALSGMTTLSVSQQPGGLGIAAELPKEQLVPLLQLLLAP